LGFKYTSEVNPAQLGPSLAVMSMNQYPKPIMEGAAGAAKSE